MKNQRLKLDKTGMEQGSRVAPDFPIAGGGYVNIDDYEGGRFECHFHEEIELTLIDSGEMYYRANDKTILLHAGDAVFVNVNVMHAGWQQEGKNCRYSPLNFSTVLISGHERSRIERCYIDSLVENSVLPYLVIRADDPTKAPLLACINKIYAIKREVQPGYEMLLKAECCLLWYLLYQIASQKEAVEPRDRGESAIKTAISFMKAHYTEHLTLSDLAGACGLSRSEFCRVFHRFTGRTPFNYLQHLRIRRSLPLLQERELSITEVAACTGFSGGSYYAEVFRRFMGMSPLSYRQSL